MYKLPRRVSDPNLSLAPPANPHASVPTSHTRHDAPVPFRRALAKLYAACDFRLHTTSRKTGQKKQSRGQTALRITSQGERTVSPLLLFALHTALPNIHAARPSWHLGLNSSNIPTYKSPSRSPSHPHTSSFNPQSESTTTTTTRFFCCCHCRLSVPVAPAYLFSPLSAAHPVCLCALEPAFAISQTSSSVQLIGCCSLHIVR